MTRNLDTVQFENMIRNKEEETIKKAKEMLREERLLWFIAGAMTMFTGMTILYTMILWAAKL